MEEFNNQQNQIEPEKSGEVEISTQPYSPYPLISPIAAAFLGLFGAFFLFHIIGNVIAVLIIGYDLNSVPADVFRLITILAQILLIFIPALLFGKWIYGDNSKIISLKRPNFKELFLFVLGILILTPLLQTYLYIQNYFFEQWASTSEFIYTLKYALDVFDELLQKTYLNLMSADNIGEMFFVIITISIIPAICEEVLFRGYIQRSFELKVKPHIAALITAVLFGAFHLIPTNVIPLTIIGFYLGFAAYSSQSLVIPIILHFLNNFIAVMLYFIVGDENLLKSNVSDAASLDMNVIYFFLLLIMFIALMFFIRNYYKKSKIVQEV